MLLITQAQLITFGLIFTRLLTMALTAPVLSNREVFSMGKVVLMFWLASLMIFVVPLPLVFPSTALTFILALISEMLIGLILGYVAQLMIYGFQFAGNLMDTQAGLSVAQLLDPSTGQNSSLLQNILQRTAILVFLLLNGHHVILATLVQSFVAVPIAASLDLSNAMEYVARMSVLVLELGLQIAAPVVLVVFIVDFGFGMLSRVAPQVNVFQLGFQVKPVAGVLVFLFSIPVMVDLTNFILEQVSDILLRTLFLMRI